MASDCPTQMETQACEAECVSSEQSSKSSALGSKASEQSSKALKRGGSFRPGGTLPSSLCLAKAAIGAGVLSISAHSAPVGYAYMLGCLMIGGVLTVVGIRMIAQASVETKCKSFEDICEELFHPCMSIWTGFINVCNCIGAAASYLIVCGEIFAVLTNAGETMRANFVILAGIFICGPLALAPHVSFMRYLAFGSVCSMILLVITVAIYCAEHGVDDSVDERTLWLGPGQSTFFTYMNTVNIIIFAYNNQFNVPQLTQELTPQPSANQMSIVGLFSSGLCFVLYSAVSLFGTLAFGVGDEQKDTLIVDLYPDRKSPLVVFTLCAVMFSVLTCFQFHIYPVRQFCLYIVRKIRGRGACDTEGDDVVYFGKSLTRWLDILGALLAVAIAILIAVALTEVKQLLDFVGAFAGAWVSYVIPPLFIIQIHRKKDNFSWLTGEMLFCSMFCLLGLFLFVFGTYAAIVG